MIPQLSIINHPDIFCPVDPTISFVKLADISYSVTYLKPEFLLTVEVSIGEVKVTRAAAETIMIVGF